MSSEFSNLRLLLLIFSYFTLRSYFTVVTVGIKETNGPSDASHDLGNRSPDPPRPTRTHRTHPEIPESVQWSDETWGLRNRNSLSQVTLLETSQVGLLVGEEL